MNKVAGFQHFNKCHRNAASLPENVSYQWECFAFGIVLTHTIHGTNAQVRLGVFL